MTKSILPGPQPNRSWLNSDNEVAFLQLAQTGATAFGRTLNEHVKTNNHYPVPGTWDAVFAAAAAIHAQAAAGAVTGPNRLGPIRALSGPFMLCDVLQHFPQARFATLLRRPADRVAALVRQLYRLTQASLPESEHRPIEDWIDHAWSQLRPQVEGLSVFLLGGTHADILTGVAAEDRFEAARSNLDRMAFVGLSERFEDSLLLAALDNDLDIIRYPRPDPANDLAPADPAGIPLDILAEYLEYDAALYDEAAELFGGRLRRRLAKTLDRLARDSEATPPEPLGDSERHVPMKLPVQARTHRSIAFHRELFNAPRLGVRVTRVRCFLPARSAPVRGLTLWFDEGTVPPPLKIALDDRPMRTLDHTHDPSAEPRCQNFDFGDDAPLTPRDGLVEVTVACAEELVQPERPDTPPPQTLSRTPSPIALDLHY